MNPALVYRYQHRFFAWNEDGRRIGWRSTFDALQLMLHCNGYYIISPNSRLAATIRDKMRLNFDQEA